MSPARTPARTVAGLLATGILLTLACGSNEPAPGTQQTPAATVAAAPTTTTTTTTTMPAPPAVWRTARWGMKKAELLAVFPDEAKRLPRPADFGQPRPGRSDVAIASFDGDGATFRVLFGIGAEGLSRIQLTALKPSPTTCEDLEKRLTEEHGKGSRVDTGTSLRGEATVWTTATETITLHCVEKPSLGYRSVTLDYEAGSSQAGSAPQTGSSPPAN